MTNKILLALLATSLGFVGCKQKSTNYNPKAAAMVKKACACKEAACAKALQKELSTLSDDLVTKASGDDGKKARQTIKKAHACVEKLLAGGDAADSVVNNAKDLAKRMCACKNKGCREAIAAKFGAMKKTVKLPKNRTHEYTAAIQKYAKCAAVK